MTKERAHTPASSLGAGDARQGRGAGSSARERSRKARLPSPAVQIGRSAVDDGGHKARAKDPRGLGLCPLPETRLEPPRQRGNQGGISAQVGSAQQDTHNIDTGQF